MEEIIKNSYIQLGAMGVLVVFMACAICKMWTQMKEMDVRNQEQASQFTVAMTKVATALTELSTIIKMNKP